MGGNAVNRSLKAISRRRCCVCGAEWFAYDVFDILANLQDAAMLSEADVWKWQRQFTKQLPYRKLKKLVLSLPVNLWYEQLHTSGMLPSDCQSVRDLILYETDEHWRQIHVAWSLKTSAGSWSNASYARMQPEVSVFKKHASSVVYNLGQEEKLQDIWHRYGAGMEVGFGLKSAGIL